MSRGAPSRRAAVTAAVVLVATVLVGATVAGGLLLTVVAATLVVQGVTALARSLPPPAPSRSRHRRRGRLRRVGRVPAVVVVRIVPAMVGCLALLVAADWAAGRTWDRLTGSDGEVTSTLDLATTDLPPAEDERVHSPAMADAPWADRYFAEMEAIGWTYVPFVGAREQPVRGRYISSAGGIRRSYRPRGADGDDAVDVWFFGGSTLWGEGQRDLHTIPSEVARLAEADGLALRASNFGVRGFSAFQELLALEGELARREPPDLVVFYHGFNELSTQTEAPGNLSAQPSIFQLEVTADAFERAPALPTADTPVEPSVVRDYVDTSAAHRLARAMGTILSVRPAGADDADEEEPFFRPPPIDMARAVDNAEAIYRRTVALLLGVVAAHDVTPVIFWQPAVPTGQDPWYDELGARVADVGGGIDIADALDDAPGPIYIDGVHTNELGARLSAEAIWEHLAPVVREASAR